MKKAILVVLVVSACQTPGVGGAATRPSITTGPISWKVTENSASFSATGTALVQISDTTHGYLLLYRVMWAKKLDPADTAATERAITFLMPGQPNKVQIGDYSLRCDTYTTSNCLRRAQDPVASLELVGWTRLESPN